MPQAIPPVGDPTDPDLVYLIPFTTDGRLLAVTEQHRGHAPYWTVPAARRKHPRADPGAVARRIVAALRFDNTILRPLLLPAADDCLPAVYAATVTWTDRRPWILGHTHHQVHALPTDRRTLLTLDLRPAHLIALLADLADLDGEDLRHTVTSSTSADRLRRAEAAA